MRSKEIQSTIHRSQTLAEDRRSMTLRKIEDKNRRLEELRMEKERIARERYGVRA
jgi:ABC-type phosphate transport system auxiliary subunit